MTEILAAVAILAGWLVFRLGRLAQRHSSVSQARARLRALKGILEGAGGKQGWGETYFATIYDDREAARRANADRAAIEKRSINQVFVVPTEPLEVLAAATGTDAELISERMILAANLALWRVRVFNQFVELQTAFHARHVAEITDRTTTGQRLTDLGVAADIISNLMHGAGIGQANAPGGWYRELKEAVGENLDELERNCASLWWRFLGGERRLLVGDVALLATLVYAVVDASCAGI